MWVSVTHNCLICSVGPITNMGAKEKGQGGFALNFVLFCLGEGGDLMFCLGISLRHLEVSGWRCGEGSKCT